MMIKLNKSLHTIKKILLTVFLHSVVTNAYALTALANKPLFVGNTVPGNVAIEPSVQFPTPTGVAYGGVTFLNANDYYGYFDKDKCYVYQNKFISNLLFNTGVDNKNVALPFVSGAGGIDTHWVYTTYVGTGPPVTANLSKTNVAPAIIDSVFIGNRDNQPAGGFVYRATFTMPTTLPANKIKATFNLKADDSLVSVSVNGVLLTGLPVVSATLAGLITIDAGSFKAGTNTVDISIANAVGASKTGIQITDMQMFNVDTFNPYTNI